MSSSNSPPTIQPAQPKKKHGCLFYGCMMALIGIGCCLLLLGLFVAVCMPPTDNQLIKGFAQRRADLEKLRTMVEHYQTGSPWFFADDFKGQFTTSNLIASITADGIKLPSKRESEIATLNILIGSANLHRKFPRIPLPKEAEDLTKRKLGLSGGDRMQLNRFILEAAYPERCPKRDRTETNLTEYRRLLRSVGFGVTRWLPKPDGDYQFGGGRAYFAAHGIDDPTPYGIVVRVWHTNGILEPASRSYVYLYYPPEQITHWIPPSRHNPRGLTNGYFYFKAPQAKDAFRQLDHLQPLPAEFPSSWLKERYFTQIEENWYVDPRRY